MFGTHLDDHRRKSSQLRMVDPHLSLACPCSNNPTRIPPSPQHKYHFSPDSESPAQNYSKLGKLPLHRFWMEVWSTHTFEGQTDLVASALQKLWNWCWSQKAGGWYWCHLAQRVDLVTACEGPDHKSRPTMNLPISWAQNYKRTKKKVELIV